VIILAHRGFWKAPSEKNAAVAFERAFAAGYGVELDVRDFAGELVISHDPPRDRGLTFDALLDLHDRVDPTTPLAINIKADGLAAEVKAALSRHQASDMFVFDMSVPDTLHYARDGARLFTRYSEYEPHPALYETAAGVWLDCFEQDLWWGREAVERFLADGKQVAIVSPELHRRDHAGAWAVWRALAQETGTNGLMLCTDLPDAAEAYFQ
jgi:glycerophosphoryl diester phosphodiesterase